MHPAAMDDSSLLAECELRRQRRSGPGGQHRNKVETAVVITHTPTGVSAEASERRSQEENRRRALFRLRVRLALEIRRPVLVEGFSPSALWLSRCRGGRLAVNPEHTDFPTLLAEAIDVLTAWDLDARLAASRLSCTPSQLIKLLQREPQAIAQVNQRRIAAGKPPYH